MIEFCGASQADLLNRYWDQVAMETMRSIGKVHSDLRRFLIEPRYRSAFLDDLFARKDFVDPAVPNGPLIKGLLDHFKRAWSDREFRDQDIAFRKELQKRECARLGIQTAGWTGKKRGIIPFVDEFCVALAFKRRGNRWHKKGGGGLIFEVGLDLGGDHQRVGAPLVFWIFHESDLECVFEMGGNERSIGSFTEADCIGHLLIPTNAFSEFGLTLSYSTSSPHRLGLLSKPRVRRMG